MPDLFVIAFRESIQCSLMLSLLLFYQTVKEKSRFRLALLSGISVAFVSGFLLGYLPDLTKDLISMETWTFWRYLTEFVIFYAGMIVLIIQPSLRDLPVSAGLFTLGFGLIFFEARGVGLLAQDMGVMKDSAAGAVTAALSGLSVGFIPLLLFRKRLMKVPFEQAFSAASILIMIGALQFGFGGVGEIEKDNSFVPLQRNLISFLSDTIRSLQSLLLISDHPFMIVPLTGLAKYFASDRTALAMTLAAIMAPPLFMLIRIFSRPDPLVHDLQAGAEKRQTIAFFRRELVYQAMPVITSFIILIVILHAGNVSLNPLYEPPPVPVRADENSELLRIYLSDKTGSLEDRKMRKYVYYYGNKQIIFMAILKPDGTVGVALDECEVCRPADWNTDAKGYAQKGDHLICKYCMTPIATSTLNNPGGCNPVPIPFAVEDFVITIKSADLIATFNKLQELEKRGGHL